MKKKILSAFASFLAIASLTACGTDPEITQFKREMDEFCASVAEINNSINNINAEADNAAALALGYLDKLDKNFQDFAELDFPEEYDYLESLADEAGEYMKAAVESYHIAYADEGYDEEAATYARENSARAFKRIQVILDVLHGNNPTDETESGEQ